MGTGADRKESLAPVEVYRGDCLALLPLLPGQSIPLVIADLPYGVTGCHWDSKIDLDAFWTEVRRVLLPTGAVIMFGTQPFTSELVTSNRPWFKYELIWKKSDPTMFQLCRQRPLSEHEDILVFSPGTICGAHQSSRGMTYNPQGLIKLKKPIRRKPEQRVGFLGKTMTKGGLQRYTNYPRSILNFRSVSKPTHETEKPVDLLRYLIQTFSNPGDPVLDPSMGSGSTGEAALREGRKFVGMELDGDYFEEASTRVRRAYDEMFAAP